MLLLTLTALVPCVMMVGHGTRASTTADPLSVDVTGLQFWREVSYRRANAPAAVASVVAGWLHHRRDPARRWRAGIMGIVLHRGVGAVFMSLGTAIVALDAQLLRRTTL